MGVSLAGALLSTCLYRSGLPAGLLMAVNCRWRIGPNPVKRPVNPGFLSYPGARHRRNASMFIAMNRFKVKKGSEHDFEQVWLTRDSHLKGVPGFIAFHLLKGPERDDHVLYASHSLWRSEAAFSRLDAVGRLSQDPCRRGR